MKFTNKNHIQKGFLLVLIIFLLTSCAKYENTQACLEGHTYGILGGLWHGLISPIGLISMFFDPDVAVFAPNNNGFLYSLGFVIGSGGWGFLGGRKSSSN